MTSIPRTSGIYKIICTANGKIYVGSSQNLKQRWYEHQRDLRGHYHGNIHLQRAWDKYGETSFVFEVIELVMPWALLDREDFWLKKLNPCNRKIGFNIASKATAPMKGRQHTAETKRTMSLKHRGNTYCLGHNPSLETRKKLSIARIKQGNPWTGHHHSLESRLKIGEAVQNREITTETRAKISESKKGKPIPAHVHEASRIAHLGKKQSPEHIAKNKAANNENWIVENPNGEKIFVSGLKQFCKENNLNASLMYRVAKGDLSHHKQWKCRKVED